MKLDFINHNFQRIAAEVVAAGIAAAAQTGQAYAQGRMNRKTRKFSEHMYDRQREDALADWNRTNAYNSPTQQMQRLREAGLNPHLIYGGSGNVTDAAPVRSSDFKAPEQRTPDYGNIVQGGVNTYLETKSFQAQQKLLDAQTLKVLTEVNTNQFDLSQKQRLADTQAAIIKNIMDAGGLSNRAALQDIEYKGKLYPANLEKLDTETRKLFQEISNETQRHQYDLLQRSSDVAKTTQEIINLRGTEVLQKLDMKLKSGELTQQAYQKETNKIEQMIKYAQQQAIMDSKRFDTPDEAFKYIQSIFGLGTSLIK